MTVPPSDNDPQRPWAQGPQQPWQPQPPGQQGPPPPPTKPKRRLNKFGLGCMGALGLVVVIVIIAIAANSGGGGGGNSPSHGTGQASKTTPTPAATATATPTPAPAPKATQAPAAPAAPNSVSFAVWGNDGGTGTDIQYSSDSNSQQANAEIEGGSATAPAWTGSLPYDSNAEYYAINAQLNGSGTLYCSLTIVDAGKTYTHTATASGDYQLCNVELVAGFLGGWSAS